MGAEESHPIITNQEFSPMSQPAAKISNAPEHSTAYSADLLL